jgi:acyl carrier protein
MIPAKFIQLPTLPINKNGKVDRDAIRVAAMAVTIEPTEPDKVLTSETEKAIARLWQRMMHRNDISPASHFFAIGGDSLAAVSLNLQLEQLFDITLPAQLVLESPVLRDFAARIDLIKMQKQADTETGFIFPLVSLPGTIPVFFCGVDLTMAQTWSLPCSLFAIAYWARGGKMIEMESMESMASLYVEGILKHQPEGPYRIGGYSFGAILGLEIAQQLMARGKVVEMLFLLDPYLPYKADLPTTSESNEVEPFNNQCNRIDNKLKRNFARARRKYQTNGMRGFLSFLFPKLEQIPGGYWLVYQLFHLQARYPNPVAEKLVSRKLWPAFWYTARRKLALYTAKPYAGRSLLVFTPGQGGEDIWLRLFGQSATIRTVETEHLEMFHEKAVAHWMPVLDEALAEDKIA